MIKWTYFFTCIAATLVSVSVTFWIFFFLMQNVSDVSVNEHGFLMFFSVCAIFLCILFSFTATTLVLPLLNKTAANKDFKKSTLKIRLMKYVKDVFIANPELEQTVKFIKIRISMDDGIFQAHALGRHTISISQQWISLASCSSEGFEMLKTTLCHEMAHLYVHSNLPRWQFLKAYLPTFGEKSRRQSWYKEFDADYKGRQYYVNAGGNVKYFIAKCEMLLNATDGNRASKQLTDHPNWEARIECIENNTAPDEAVANAYYDRLRDSLAEKRKRKEKVN